MGRRKIEITPITHERNRSVTFLKRKNGLFKKAYELGVLCSVDVAVIIFEERAGHHVKLHEYCSTDVDNMVQRHIHFDGERESKHPADFSKQPDDGAHDDDDDDDEGPRPSGSGGTSSARRPSGSSGGTMGGNAGMSGRSGGSMSMSGRGAPGMGGMGSGGRVAGGMNMGLDIDYRPSSLSLPPHISSSFPSHSLPAHSFPSHSTHGLSHLSAPSFPSHTQHPSLSAHLSTQPQSHHSYSQSPTSAYPGPGSAIPVSLERHSPFNFSLPQTKRPRLDSSASSGGGTYPGGPSAYTIDDPGAHAAYLQNQNQNQGHAQSGGGGNNARSFYGQQTHGQASPPPSNASSTPSNANSNLFSGLLGTGGGGSPTATSPHHSHPPRSWSRLD